MSDIALAREILATKVGYALRMARLSREKSVDELSAESGVPRRTIVQMERGEYQGALRPISDCFFALGCEAELSIREVPADER